MYRPVPAQVEPARHGARGPPRSGGTTTSSKRSLSNAMPTARAGSSTRAHRPPTACRARTTSKARVFKDVFPRYRTMRGYNVPRKAGWDCPACRSNWPVESSSASPAKSDIERYGIAEFNAKCREVVDDPRGAFEDLTTRMGYWVDLSKAVPDDGPPRVLESVWWSLKQIFDKGLLTQDYRVAPWVSALRYRAVRSRTRAGLRDGRRSLGLRALPAHLRAAGRAGRAAGVDHHAVERWSPTTAAAVHPDVTYVVATDGEERLVVAEPLLGKALGEGWVATGERFTGREMERWAYRRPFDLLPLETRTSSVLADYHHRGRLGCRAPGARLRRGRPQDLPGVRPAVVNRSARDGTFEAELPLVGGQSFKKADEALVRGPARARAAVPASGVRAQLPALLRCHTALLYYAQPSW